jgi:multidrug efflux system outer membrane protein
VKRHQLYLQLFLVMSVAGLCSCGLLRPDLQADRAELLPQDYSIKQERGTDPTNDWWTAFQSDELNSLMDTAFKRNLTLVGAAARLRQTHALARKTGADRLPAASLELGADTTERTTTQASESGTTESTTETFEGYNIGLAASYELDLWGRVNAATHTSALDAEASRLDLEAAVMTIAAQVADRWLQLVEARAQTKLIRNQLDTNRKMLRLLKERMVKSTTRLLDVYQQEQTVLATEAALPSAEQKVELLQNEIAVLLGLPPGTDLGIAQSELPALPRQPDAGIPADLLIQRPDVRAEFLRLQAAGWNVAAARADRLPALRLTARAGYDADTIADLFDNWLANLAAGLTAPLLDGGRRRAEVDSTKAKLEEQLADYRQVILQSLAEVENALTSEHRLEQRANALDRELASARQVLGEAQHRYLRSAGDYVTVLIAIRSVQQTERNALSARRELLTNRIALCRALGGTWAFGPAERAARNRNSSNIIATPDDSDAKAGEPEKKVDQ